VGNVRGPKSERRLRGAALVAVQLCVLGAGMLALAVTGQPVLAAVYAALVVLNTVLLHVWEGEPKP
jgi:predicted signal transduction protein with EAL and GGDEF domain